MEVIFAAVAAAAALARVGDMYAAAVIGMWSSGQAGLALQRGEAREGGTEGRKGGGRCETRRRRRPTRTHTCPPHRVRPSRQKDKNPAAELSLTFIPFNLENYIYGYLLCHCGRDGFPYS